VPGILIVDDHVIVRRSVRSLLTSSSLKVCGEAEDGRDALRKLKELRPDVVLLDLEMPGMGGIEAAPEILRILPSVKIVFLTLHHHTVYAKKVAECSHAFLNKMEAGTQLVPTLRRLIAAEAPEVDATSGRPDSSFNGARRYAWQQTVADALAAPRGELAVKISAAEREIAGRLIANQIEPEELAAMREALRALRQLISETKASRAADLGEEEGVA
jgi:DNA-binding NarL/FixJ family response regulator